MKNKILIKAIFPSIEKEYDIRIPVNELVWRINKLIIKAVYDLNGFKFDLKNDSFIIIDRFTGKVYSNNEIIIDTNIRNGSELVFLRIV